MEVKDRGQGPQ